MAGVFYLYSSVESLKENKIISRYDAIHGEGKGWEIVGALGISHGYEGGLEVLKKSKGRKVRLYCPPFTNDLVVVTYAKKPTRKKSV